MQFYKVRVIFCFVMVGWVFQEEQGRDFDIYFMYNIQNVIFNVGVLCRGQKQEKILLQNLKQMR